LREGPPVRRTTVLNGDGCADRRALHDTTDLLSTPDHEQAWVGVDTCSGGNLLREGSLVLSNPPAMVVVADERALHHTIHKLGVHPDDA
jgi:hypothetical protein